MPDTQARARGVILAITGLVIAVLLISLGGYYSLSGSQAQLIGGPFTLEDGDGHKVTERDFRGKYMLIYFGYTFCPDVCPTTLNSVADALERLGPKSDKIQPLFITIDPKRDTPAVVKQYAAAFTPRLIGLTGTPDAIAQVAKEYRVYYAEHRTGPGPNDYSMDHSSILYLMSPRGTFIAPIRADESGEQIAAELQKLVQ